MSETGTFPRTFATDKQTWQRLNTLKLIDPRAAGNRSEMIRILVNEEWERRGLPENVSDFSIQFVSAAEGNGAK